MTSKKKGVPREEIPWYPTINREKCNECMSCVEFCKNNVYQDVDGESKVVNPFNCLVGCSGCLDKCPEDAISFPSMKEIIELLKELRKKYDTD